MRRGSPITLKQLRYFIAIAEAGSFSAAARNAYIAQPALSRQISLLEEELGMHLLERLHDGILLTDSGQRLCDLARFVVQTVDSLKSELHSTQDNPKGLVTIAIPVTASALLMPLIIIQAREKFPGIELVVRDGLSQETGEAIAMGQVDFGVTPNAEELDHVCVDPVFAEHLYWVGQHACPETADTITLTQAAASSLAMLPKNCSYLRRRAEQAAIQLGIELNVVYEQHTAQGLSSLVRSGLAATICNWPAVREGSPYPPLMIVEPRLYRTISIAHSAHKPLSFAASCIRDLVRGMLVEAVRSGNWSGELIKHP